MTLSGRGVYLISEPFIADEVMFFKKLEAFFATKLVKVFQLRLKNVSEEVIIRFSIAIKELCGKYSVKFILNDRYDLFYKIYPDGVHIGSEDGNLIEVQKFVPKGTIIGISCYDDLDFAIKCSFDGASYVAFGAFFATKTKNAKTKPSQQIIMQYKLSGSSAKVCAIGGLTEKNISRMCFYGLDYACVIGRVWSQPSINLSVTKLKQIARKLK